MPRPRSAASCGLSLPTSPALRSASSCPVSPGWPTNSASSARVTHRDTVHTSAGYTMLTGYGTRRPTPRRRPTSSRGRRTIRTSARSWPWLGRRPVAAGVRLAAGGHQGRRGQRVPRPRAGLPRPRLRPASASNGRGHDGLPPARLVLPADLTAGPARRAAAAPRPRSTAARTSPTASRDCRPRRATTRGPSTCSARRRCTRRSSSTAEPAARARRLRPAPVRPGLPAGPAAAGGGRAAGDGLLALRGAGRFAGVGHAREQLSATCASGWCRRPTAPSPPCCEDLADRGLLDETLVVCMGEFGRSPRSQRQRRAATTGRMLQSILLAGAGIRGGSVYGSTDRPGRLPGHLPLSPRRT